MKMGMVIYFGSNYLLAEILISATCICITHQNFVYSNIFL